VKTIRAAGGAVYRHGSWLREAASEMVDVVAPVPRGLPHVV